MLASTKHFGVSKDNDGGKRTSLPAVMIGLIAITVVGLFIAYVIPTPAKAADITWTSEQLTQTALNMTTVEAELDVAETQVAQMTILANDHRTTMRMALATLLLNSEVQFNKCWHRPSSHNHPEAVIIEFPIANLWGDVTQFLFATDNVMNSTFLSQKNGHVTADFTEISCKDKRASRAYRFLQEVLDTLLNAGKLPFYPG